MSEPINLTDKYEYNDIPVTVLCTNKRDKYYPVVILVHHAYGDALETCTEDGFFGVNKIGERIEKVSPYKDWKIDDKVLVRQNSSSPWRKRYYAGLDAQGQPCTWGDGATSWSTTTNYKLCWGEAKLFTGEEDGN